MTGLLLWLSFNGTHINIATWDWHCSIKFSQFIFFAFHFALSTVESSTLDLIVWLLAQNIFPSWNKYKRRRKIIRGKNNNNNNVKCERKSTHKPSTEHWALSTEQPLNLFYSYHLPRQQFHFLVTIFIIFFFFVLFCHFISFAHFSHSKCSHSFVWWVLRCEIFALNDMKRELRPSFRIQHEKKRRLNFNISLDPSV